MKMMSMRHAIKVPQRLFSSSKTSFKIEADCEEDGKKNMNLRNIRCLLEVRIKSTVRFLLLQPD